MQAAAEAFHNVAGNDSLQYRTLPYRGATFLLSGQQMTLRSASTMAIEN